MAKIAKNIGSLCQQSGLGIGYKLKLQPEKLQL